MAAWKKMVLVGWLLSWILWERVEVSVNDKSNDSKDVTDVRIQIWSQKPYHGDLESFRTPEHFNGLYFCPPPHQSWGSGTIELQTLPKLGRPKQNLIFPCYDLIYHLRDAGHLDLCEPIFVNYNADNWRKGYVHFCFCLLLSSKGAWHYGKQGPGLAWHSVMRG